MSPAEGVSYVGPGRASGIRVSSWRLFRFRINGYFGPNFQFITGVPHTRPRFDSGRMKRTLSVVVTAVLMSMMALTFLSGLLKKAGRAVDGLHNRSG